MMFTLLGLLFYLVSTRDPGHSTRNARGGGAIYDVYSATVYSSIWCCKRSWSWHQKCKRRRAIRNFQLTVHSSTLVPQDYPGHSTRNCKRRRWDFKLISSTLLILCHKKSWSWHQKCKRRRWEFMMFTLLSGATRYPGHSTRNARGGGDFW